MPAAVGRKKTRRTCRKSETTYPSILEKHAGDLGSTHFFCVVSVLKDKRLAGLSLLVTAYLSDSCLSGTRAHTLIRKIRKPCQTRRRQPPSRVVFLFFSFALHPLFFLFAVLPLPVRLASSLSSARGDSPVSREEEK